MSERVSRCLFGYMAVQIVLLGAIRSAEAESQYYVDPSARITVAGSAENEVSGGLDGSMAVWYSGTTGMVYVRDLADPDSTSRPIGNSGRPSHVRISGNHVVWYDSTNYHVYACDISQPSPTPTQLTSAPSRENMWTEISGNMVVWRDDRSGGPRGIWGYDLSEPNRGDFLIVDGQNTGRLWPNISENWLVWYEELSRIRAMDLGDPSAEPFTLDSSSAIGHPSIDGTTIVYNKSRGGNNWDLYGFDLSDIAAGPFQISITDNNELAGDVSGNIAIYKYTEDHETIRAVDLTDITAGEFTISGDDLISNSYMAISGEWIMWREDGDVYANRIIPEPATMSLLALGGLALLRRRRKQ